MNPAVRLATCAMLSVAVSLAGCGGEGKSISGQLDRQSAAATPGSSYAITSGDIDQIWALPIYGTSAHSSTFTAKVVLPVDADGSFLFEIDDNESYDYVLALVDSSKCTSSTPRGEWVEADIDLRLGCIQGYVSVADAENSDAMVAIPTSTQSGSVTLGKLQPSGSLAQSIDTNLSDVSGSYALDLEGLKAIARIDNMLLGLSYFFANQDDNLDRFYNQNLAYSWVAPFAIDNTKNQFAPASNLDYFGSVHYFAGNVDASTLIASVQATDGYLSVTPPGDIVLDRDGLTYGPSSPISSTAPGTVDGTKWYDEVLGFDVNGDSIFGGAGGFTGVPTGEWTFSRGGDVVSKSDLSLTLPFASTNGVFDETAPIVFVPEIKVNTNGDTVVDIEVRFTQWNGSTFAEFPFNAAISTLRTAQLAIHGDDSAACPNTRVYGQAGTGTNDVVIGANGLRWTPPGTWKYGAGDATTCGLTGVTAGYDISSNSFDFQWSIDDQRR